MVVERDSSEFARLSQLGDILGLNPMEINSVHTGLAEQAYRGQVQQVCPPAMYAAVACLCESISASENVHEACRAARHVRLAVSASS